MPANHIGKARHDACDRENSAFRDQTAPRAAFSCRWEYLLSIGFALTLLLLGGFLPAVGFSTAVAAPAADYFHQHLDLNGNNIEDVLDRWRAGQADWPEVQQAGRLGGLAAKAMAPAAFPEGVAPYSGVVAAGRVRVICLGAVASQLTAAQAAGNARGTCDVLQSVAQFGGVTVLAVDSAGLAGFLDAAPGCVVMLDREGVPALVNSRHLVGVGRVTSGSLDLGNDWSATVAILDSGMDSAHGDLGDANDDDRDGPPPAVGDAQDWYPATSGWPLSQDYKAVGWHDVTDDFPDSQGPWDYYYHGTALASVVAGSGAVNSQYRGLAPGGRLTIVKYYDFDETWHAWAGDFLAACAWTLDNRATYRVRTVLMAANWDVDAGISAAMAAFVDAGLLPVAAMGNFGTAGTGPGYPASLPDVLTVGAANASGAVSAFSGRGLPGDMKPDLVAPGGGLLPEMGRIVAADNEPNDTYSGRFGTSLAAAHVAGAAFMLDEALLENGLAPATDRFGVVGRQAVLRMTGAFVDEAETPDGTGTTPLPGYTGHQSARGYGLLRVDAAVHAMIDPLSPGEELPDTLSSDWQKPVLARRLNTSAGVRYLVDVRPAAGLDVAVSVVEVGGAGQLLQLDLNGPGIAESGYYTPSAGSWSFLVVKRISGAGPVTLSLLLDDTVAIRGAEHVLPGVGAGASNVGDLAPFDGPSLLIPSRVLVDPVARSLNVLDTAGNLRPGWPVFVFPASSSQGDLTQPSAVNLDGIRGDEVVVASDYGSVYFFTGDGAVKTVDLALNRSLTAPVGFQNAVGGWRVLVVDRLGWARTWSWNAAVGADPELDSEIFLDHTLPLAPAAGRLTNDGGESLVIAFADGWLGVLDENLNLRNGWPLLLGSALEVPPVLVDLDRDGFQEIVLPVRDEASGQLVMRVFDGNGNTMPGDGAIVPAPGGGGWMALSAPAVAGWYDTADLNVLVAGLVDNGQSGADASWSMALGRLYANGVTAATALSGFALHASTAEGVLQPNNVLLNAPLAWNRTGTLGTEASVLFHVSWVELLYGLTALPGASTGWLQGVDFPAPLAQKQPLLLGGSQQSALGHLGGMLVPLDNGQLLRVNTVDQKVNLVPVSGGLFSSPLWRAERGDQRNSGAYPLPQSVTTVAPRAGLAASLQAFPNPGTGHIRFRAKGTGLAADTQLEIYDLRGRRVRRLRGADSAGLVRWDGRDDAGRDLAAGTYLAVARSAGQRLRTRLILTR